MLKKICFLFIFTAFCASAYPIPVAMTSANEGLCVWGLSYSFGPANGRNYFGDFFWVDASGSDRTKNFWGGGLDIQFAGWDYFLLTADLYYVLNAGNSSSVICPLKLGVGLVNINCKDNETPLGYTISAGIMDFASQIGSDGKSYFCPYADASLDGTFSWKLNPRLEVSPAFGYTWEGGSSSGYYYTY